MKIFKKAISIALLLSFLGFIIFSFYYLTHVSFGTDVRIFLLRENKIEIKTVSPTGGIIILDYDSINNCYCNQGRFYKGILISGDTSDLNIRLEIRGSIIHIGSDELVKETDGCLYINKHLYPRYTLFEKLKDLKKIDFHKQFYFRISQIIAVLLKYLILIGFCGLFVWLILFIIKKFKTIKYRTCEYFSRITYFIRKNKLKLLLPFIFSIIPGLIFLLFDPDVLGFLSFSLWEFVLITGALFFPFSFAIYFSGSLKLNRWFWISFASIFIVTYFILFPNIYIYGAGYRDDISKFFVKAFQYNFFDDLFVPNSGYLAVFQSIVPFFILKVLGIRQYLPEAIQFVSLIFSSLIFASFNLKTFRTILPDDRKRFLISLILGLAKLALPVMLFMYEIPFIAAILFWLILFRMESFSTKGFVFCVLTFVIFIFSKPIFFIFMPILFVILILGLVRKEKKYIVSSMVWLIAILIQILVYRENPVNTVNEYSAYALGTNYISDFRTDSISLLNNLIIGVYINVRMLFTLLIPYLVEGWRQAVANSLLFALMIFMNIYLLFRYVKYRKQLDLILITGNVLAFISSLLFVRTVSVQYLAIDTKTLLQMNFGELLQSDYVLPYHRYLVLGFLPVALSLVYVVFVLSKPFLKKYSMLVIFFLLFFMIINRWLSFKSELDKTITDTRFQAVFSVIPAQSVWRQNSNLIFDYPNAYYIPYYGYPQQPECIRNGIDRITDVKIPDHGSIFLDSLPYDTRNWEIIELITEFDPAVNGKLAGALAHTRENDSVFVRPYNPVDSDHRFIIFRFDSLMKLKEIKFVDKDNNKLILSNNIRLVGKYE